MENSTRAIHIGEENIHGGVVAPIDLSSTYAQENLPPDNPYFYSRLGNPTLNQLELKLASLEDAKFALAFSSGMGAISTTIFALMEAGDSILAFDDIYGGTLNFLNNTASKFKIGVDYVDATSVKNIEKALKAKTKIIWLESPTNPMLKLCDIAEIARLKEKQPDLIIVVDNTFASPVGQRPLELGADVSLHSLTKYISGHSDVIAGTIMANREDIYYKISEARTNCGTVLSPFDSFLVARGAKTLYARMKLHEKNAGKIAKSLIRHKNVEWVRYPGLTSHPQHELAMRQMKNFSGMITFKLGGTFENVQKFLKNLELVSCAVSLGGVETLIEVPALMTHRCAGDGASTLDSNIIRLSVGIEDADDLIKDLSNALEKAF